MTSNQPLFHVNITDYIDTSVGECVEVPVIVEGNSDQEIKQKMGEILKGYFEVFPEKKSEIFKKRSITIPAAF